MSNKLIAITGGMGSGKSTVSEIIKSIGYPVYSADAIYKDLIKNENFVKQIYTAIDIETNDYTFNKDLISSKVFNNKVYLEKLNSVTHPTVINELKRLSNLHKGLVFNEVPLLFESKLESYYDVVIVVKRNLEERISSVSIRDGISREEIIKRINNQFNYENLSNTAYTLICNDGSYLELSDKVKAVIEGIVKKQ